MCVIGNFQSLEAVDRGSETQTQVVENLNPFILSWFFTEAISATSAAVL